MRQELLLRPTSSELPQSEQQLIEAAAEKVEADPWYLHGGFDLSVNPQHIGYSINRKAGRAVPVYRTDSGVYAVDHLPNKGSDSHLSIPEALVYTRTR